MALPGTKMKVLVCKDLVTNNLPNLKQLLRTTNAGINALINDFHFPLPEPFPMERRVAVLSMRTEQDMTCDEAREFATNTELGISPIPFHNFLEYFGSNVSWGISGGMSPCLSAGYGKRSDCPGMTRIPTMFQFGLSRFPAGESVSAMAKFIRDLDFIYAGMMLPAGTNILSVVENPDQDWLRDVETEL